jgi:hypothetical protein
MDRVQAYLVVCVCLYLTLVNAKPQECDRLTPSAVCEANGVGIFCNPCNAQSYIVCAAYQAAQVEYCAEGRSHVPTTLASRAMGRLGSVVDCPAAHCVIMLS